MTTEQAFADMAFPLLNASLAKHPRRAHDFQAGLQVLAHALVAGGMRKVVHDGLKSFFSDVVEQAWKDHVATPFFGGKCDHPDQAVRELEWSLCVMGLHAMLATKKKLDRSTVTGPEIDAMRALANEICPLAHAMADAAKTLVKGRAAPSLARATAQENPNKIVRTCPCCFRAIALTGQTMAHHGYERPGQGSQTSSCMGTLFAPLEVSSEGLAHIIEIEKSQLKLNRIALAACPKRQSIDEVNFVTRKLETLTPTDGHRWTQALDGLIDQIKSEVKHGSALLIELNKRLAVWVQTEPSGLGSVRKIRMRVQSIASQENF